MFMLATGRAKNWPLSGCLNMVKHPVSYSIFSGWRLGMRMVCSGQPSHLNTLTAMFW